MQTPPQFSANFPRRSTIATVAFVFACLLSSARLDVDAPRHADSTDMAGRSDPRFAALKAALPTRGVIGYIGESGNSATPDYYLAQYALAPLIVERAPDHAIVIGNFPTSTPPELPENLQLEKDFGHGVFLLSNRQFAPAPQSDTAPRKDAQ